MFVFRVLGSGFRGSEFEVPYVERGTPSDRIPRLDTPEPSGLAQPGQMFGAYRIERMLGRGGMGVVFLAFDTTLHRNVALKIVDSRGDDEATRARVLREARNTQPP